MKYDFKVGDKVKVKNTIIERPDYFNDSGYMDYMLEFPRPVLEVIDVYGGTIGRVDVQCLQNINIDWRLNSEDIVKVNPTLKEVSIYDKI